MLNEKQITYLLTVAEERNITAAARKLYISQPALSRMILDIEKELGTQLFIRDRGNLHPSQAGEIYLTGCRDLLLVSRSVSKKISDLNDSLSGQVRLGITSLTGEFLFPRILEAFEEKFPHVELVLSEARMNVLRTMVKQGKLDMAFVYNTGEPELSYTPVLQDPVYLQVPPRFLELHLSLKKSRAVYPDIPFEWLFDQPAILLREGRGMREIADHALSHFEIIPVKLIETESIHLARSLVELNKGFTFIPGIAVTRFTADKKKDYFCRIKDYPMQRTLYCCYGKYSYLTEAEKYLMELVSGVQTNRQANHKMST
ncbi:MAG: LysR family transcriptional regulator [Lachnospiraceae bacterium]|nr:LysR family transcriptional regulator [Lachnospiraceae bacterium]